MRVGVEATLVADFAVTLGAGVEVRLARGGGELCRLAYGAQRAAGEGGDLRERVGRGRGAAPVRRRRGRPPRALAPGIHLQHPPRSLRRQSGLAPAPHLPGALRAGCSLCKGGGC